MAMALKHARKILASAALAGGTGYIGYKLYKLNANDSPIQAAAKPDVWLSKLPLREEQVDIMSKTPEYDVLIVGGGCTGAGIAVDSASRGLKTALVEKFDYSSGTSSRSTKLIHGGVRYLQKAIMNLDYEQVNF